MKHIRSLSTMWRATCSFPMYKTDIRRDYVRAHINEVDMLSFKGLEQCRKVDYINIRGHVGTNVTVAFWQNDIMSFHTDSSKNPCDFNAISGSKENEDNFGFYEAVNHAFRCTESSESTTQYWYGVNV